MKTTHIKALLAIMTMAGSVLTAIAAENPIVKEITPYVNKNLKSPGEMVFIDANTYACKSDDGRTIDLFDITSGKKTETIFDVANTREAQIGRIEGFKFSPDMRKILVWNVPEMIYRRSFKARYYFYDRHSRILKPLSDQFAETRDPIFSPDSRMIAFVSDNNVYIRKLDYLTEVAVTDDGKKDEIINGSTDWVYEEEFGTTSIMAFTSDNTALVYLKSNETDVPTYTLPLYAGYCDRKEQYELYPGILSYKYPVAGQKNSVVTLQSYEISNRKTKEIAFTDKTIEYIPRIDAMPGNDHILVTTLNRDQNRMEMYDVNPKTLQSVSVFVEKSEAWIIPEAYEKLTVLNDGFVVLSARSGYTHAYKYAFNGSLTRTISQGNFDVLDFYGIDALGNAYLQCALPSPINRTVCKVDTKGVKTPLSAETGCASAIFSPECNYAVLNYSDVETPPVYTLVNNKGKELRTLVNNQDARTAVPNLASKEFFKVSGDNGLEFNAYIIKPRNFDPSRKYPVVMYQYSGPGSQQVLNKWDLSWEYYFADKDIVVFCLDGRGTGGRGTDFMFPVYKKLGYYETIDQLAGARWLANQPWVDKNRLGMHGWSYGGYETLMCLQASGSPWSAGVAIAPVTDWRFYDSIYAERYMLTPQQNFDGYKQSAPLNFANNLNARLLLMYGTADDNVHPANTLEYVAELEYNGQLVDMLSFPNKNHSIYGCNARAVVYGNMYRFFKNHFAQ